MFRRTVPYEVVAEDIIQRLMTPLKGFSPDLVQAVSQAFTDGQTPERAGQALLEGLQAWQEKFQAEVHSYKETISELRDTIDQKQTEKRSLKSQMDKLEKELERVENQKEFLENTISQQNKILAGQHEQLMRLLSSTQ
jgi:peptidoglycan hydrolase CwlO-like protein